MGRRFGATANRYNPAPGRRNVARCHHISMTLNAYSAAKKMAIFEELKKGFPPSEGEFDEAVLREGKVKGEPLVGATRYEANSIFVEFIFPDPRSTSTVLVVKLVPPERIVFLPVPSWVLESIWQGEISGTYHFESEARRLYAELGAELEAGPNQKWFGPQMAKRRE